MKHQFLWLALGATALTACTSTDVVEEGPQSNAIGFENVINKSVRAGVVSGDLDGNNFDKFVVYGYYTKNGLEAHPIQVFDGVEVTKTGDGMWTYQGTRYWNVESTYYFYAYSCADIALMTDESGKRPYGNPFLNITGTTEEDRTLRITDYICNRDHQHDLICDAAEDIPSQPSGNGNVKFTFKHALCKVSAEFVNDLPDIYDVYVSNVKLVNFYDKGNLNVTDNKLEWSMPNRSETTPDIAMNINGDNKATSTLKKYEEGASASRVKVDPVYMLPVSYDNANLRFEFTITVKEGDDIFLERNIKGSFMPSWSWGNQYKYLIHITGSTAQLEEIKFEAEHEVSPITDPDGWSGEVSTDMSFSM